LIERFGLPESLQGIFFGFLWDTHKVWRLPTESSIVAFDQLAWLLELPVWTTVRGEARFDLAPKTVLASPQQFPDRWRRILEVDLVYPLEMFRSDQGRWVILDGYHRLARHRIELSANIAVRLHPDHYKARILCDSIGPNSNRIEREDAGGDWLSIPQAVARLEDIRMLFMPRR
jgi:hypothetical protein